MVGRGILRNIEVILKCERNFFEFIHYFPYYSRMFIQIKLAIMRMYFEPFLAKQKGNKWGIHFSIEVMEI